MVEKYENIVMFVPTVTTVPNVTIVTSIMAVTLTWRLLFLRKDALRDQYKSRLLELLRAAEKL